jgi:hypothetical protein
LKSSFEMIGALSASALYLIYRVDNLISEPLPHRTSKRSDVISAKFKIPVLKGAPGEIPHRHRFRFDRKNKVIRKCLHPLQLEAAPLSLKYDFGREVNPLATEMRHRLSIVYRAHPYKARPAGPNRERNVGEGITDLVQAARYRPGHRPFHPDIGEFSDYGLTDRPRRFAFEMGLPQEQKHPPPPLNPGS